MRVIVLILAIGAGTWLQTFALPRQTFALSRIEARNDGGTPLRYPVSGNLNPERGSLSCWIKLDDVSEVNSAFRNVLSMPFKGSRLGSGALWLWIRQGRPRADFSDDGDSYYQGSRLLKANEWFHLVYNWNRVDGLSVYVDGVSGRKLEDGYNLVKAAKESSRPYSFSRLDALKEFVIGYRKDRNGEEWLNGEIMDLRIFTEPLSVEDVNALCVQPPPDIAVEVERQRSLAYASKNGLALKSVGPNKRVIGAESVSGRPVGMRLFSRYSPVEVRSDSEHFNSIGNLKVGELAGMKYLEAGMRRNDRFMLRLQMKKGVPLHVLEIDYPDNALRTMEIIAQPCKDGRDYYVLQAGVFCGDEFANTGRMLTQRYLFWNGDDTDVGLVVMTAREGAAAAVGEVRVYEIPSGALPAAATCEPETGDDGWRRNFALFYEDPAVSLDFGPKGDDEVSFNELCDRLIAGMKFTGQNLLCYPGAWYHGLIGDAYMPRVHYPRYREAFMERFDREGIGFMPIIMQLSLQDVGDLGQKVSRKSIADGSLHNTAISILASGLPSGGWHGTPPNYNIAHPHVQDELMHEVEVFLSEGANHPSFKGIVLYLTRNSLSWFGDIQGGYNDYCIDQFCESEKGFEGVTELLSVDRINPLRGKMYYEIIMANSVLLDKWIDWRCRTVAEFYRRLAAKVATVRSDLKLVVNSFLLPDIEHPDFGQEHFIAESNRRAGLDVKMLEGIPNLTVAQTEIPADYRWFGPFPGRWKRSIDPVAASVAHRSLYAKRGDFENIEEVTHPWVNIHDRYFENACGSKIRKGANGQGTLEKDWFSEHPWRVSTLNPSGRHALKMFALPLFYNDVMTFSKGGFLIGTYGMEEVLVPWMRAFRALPAVKMVDCGGSAAIKIRRAHFHGKTYFYAINGEAEQRMTRFTFPDGTVDANSGEEFSGSREIELEAYGLRSFVTRTNECTTMKDKQGEYK